jgi:hypothetical protein
MVFAMLRLFGPFSGLALLVVLYVNSKLLSIKEILKQYSMLEIKEKASRQTYIIGK